MKIQHNSNRLDYGKILNFIETDEPFTFVRFGDGEINAMLGSRTSQNCDGHIYYTDMGEALRNVWLTNNPNNDNYHFGLQNLAMNSQGDKIQQFIDENNITIDFVNADILHHASGRGNLPKMFDVLKKKGQIIMLAPSYMIGMAKYYNSQYHVVVPDKNCWLGYKGWNYELSKAIARVKIKGVPIVLYMASMPAKVAINDMYNQYGQDIIQIDIGSAFDPYVGRLIRGYHKKVYDKYIKSH